MWDVAIAGAGISGLTCAVALQEAGYRVVVVEKSKGVGGRVATRRLEQTWVDHGAPTLSRDLQDEAQYGAFVSSLLQESLSSLGLPIKFIEPFPIVENGAQKLLRPAVRSWTMLRSQE